jgi:hypothetical protein
VTRNLTLWADESGGQAVQPSADRNVSRCWLDPSLFVDVVGLDFGDGRIHFYSTGDGRSWSADSSSARDAILALKRGSLLVVESAHLATPRTRKSLAQPFAAEELLDLYASARSAGITIKLFPHYHSGTRARAWAAKRFPDVQSHKKTDAADAMALALYVMNCNAVSLADPPASFSRDPKRDYGKAVRGYSSIALNAERTTGYMGRHMPHVVELGLEIFRRRGRAIGKVACYSVASLIVTEVDGVAMMFVRGGRPPGVETWSRHVARMSPFHHKAGIARSNLMRHAFRPFLRRFGNRVGVSMGTKNKMVAFSDHDDSQAATRTKSMKAFRDTLKDCYRVGVEIAIGRGFAKLDPVATPCSEVTHGR